MFMLLVTHKRMGLSYKLDFRVSYFMMIRGLQIKVELWESSYMRVYGIYVFCPIARAAEGEDNSCGHLICAYTVSIYSVL